MAIVNGKRVHRSPEELARKNGAILHALRIWGDIDENHKDGNARTVLARRLADNGQKMSASDFGNRMAYLTAKGFVTILKQGKTTYRIKLNSIPESGILDPYAGREDLPEAPEQPEFRHVIPNAWENLPVQERLVMLDELDEIATKVRESIKADLNTLAPLFAIA